SAALGCHLGFRQRRLTAIYSKKGQPCRAPDRTGAVPMADDISASVVTLHQPRPKKAKTGAERARAYRERKKRGAPLFFLAGPGRDAGRAYGTMFHPHRPQE